MQPIEKYQDAPMAYGSRESVTSLSKRIKVMVPGGDKLTDSEALALAQVSISCRLNPFIGEVWYIPGKGPFVGIKGARRYDNEEMARQGGYSWPEFVVIDPEEAGASPEQAKDCAAAFRCEVYDSISTKNYQFLLVSTIESLHNSGIQDPFLSAKEIVGARPRWIGFGFSTRSESSRMSKTQLARKRAESDALKKRINIPLVEISADDEAPFIDAVSSPAPEREPEPKRTEAQNMRELGFDPAPAAEASGPAATPPEVPDQPRSPDDIKAWMATELDARHDAVLTAIDRQLLAKLLDTTLGNQTDRYAVIRWLFDTKSGSTKDLTNAEVSAALTWQGVHGFDDMPSDVVLAETRACLLAANEAAGQGKLL